MDKHTHSADSAPGFAITLDDQRWVGQEQQNWGKQ